MTIVIEVRKLVKEYPSVRAVQGVSFQIEAGNCMGLLGPNGAGKSTTIEIMEGLIQATSGEVFYRGKKVDASFKKKAGIQFQTTSLQDFLTVRNNLALFQSFYDNPVDTQTLVEMCSLQDFLNQDASKLSGGQRQRLLLAIALVNDPDILFLDEPTTGLDPQARRDFWQLIEKIKTQGKTILLTTHYMEEAYQLCDDIAIMDHGKIIAQGSPDALLAKHFADRIVQIPRKDLKTMPLDMEYFEEDGMIDIPTHDMDNLIRKLLSHDVSFKNMSIRSRTLDDLFIELTGKEIMT